MRKMPRDEVAFARDREASMFNARVPAGSLSHLSGNRFAAPESSVCGELSAVAKQWIRRWFTYSEQLPGVFKSSQ